VDVERIHRKAHACTTHEAVWPPFQTHYFSENLVAPGIEPVSLDLQPGTLMTTRPLYNIKKTEKAGNKKVICFEF
jgi:hypothetical protein